MSNAQDRPISVLLVDDNPADIELMREVLARNCVVELSTAQDGAQALDELRRRAASARTMPDLVILDLNMPHLSGKDVLANIRRDKRLRALPVLVFTSSAHERDVSESYALGANSFVTKPSGLRAFEDALKTVSDFWFSLARLPGETRVRGHE